MNTHMLQKGIALTTKAGKRALHTRVLYSPCRLQLPKTLPETITVFCTKAASLLTAAPAAAYKHYTLGVEAFMSVLRMQENPVMIAQLKPKIKFVVRPPPVAVFTLQR